MGKIVSINAGSTSIKMAIYDDFAIQDGQTTPLAEYRWEKDVKKATVKFGVHKYVHDVPFESHTEAFKDGINRFKRAESFKYSNEIITVVNRAVNGGELLQSPDPIEITTEVQKEFERNIDLAPNLCRKNALKKWGFEHLVLMELSIWTILRELPRSSISPRIRLILSYSTLVGDAVLML